MYRHADFCETLLRECNMECMDVPNLTYLRRCDTECMDMPISVILFDLILYVPSTIFQLNRDGSSWADPVLS